MKFLPYQARWIKDESPIKLYEKTRRGGITYATSYRACIKCLRSGRKDSGFVQWVSSRDEITAKEFVTDYVARWAKEANRAAREIARQWDGILGLDGDLIEVIDEKRGITARVVRFKNGARIYSLSSNPLAFAGKGGDVLIDEWDLHPDQKAIYDMAYPCITWGGQLELVSAYDSEGSEHTEFAILCSACRNGLKPNISFHRTTIEDAIAEGFVETVNEVKIAKGGKPQTREEFLRQIKEGCRSVSAFESQYMCVPNKASGEQMISGEDLSAAQQPIDVTWIRINGMDELESRTELFDPLCWARIFGNDRYAIGWDIAAAGDLTSVFVNRLRDSYIPGKPNHEHVILITMQKCGRLTRQRDVIDAMLASSYKVVGAGDKSGLGLSDCTELELKYRIDDKNTRFRGLNFSSSKLVIGTTMQSAYAQKRQTLASSFPEIVSDIAAVRKSVTPVTKKLTFEETKNELVPESHCDIAWGNGLAIWAGENLNTFGPCFMEPLDRKGGSIFQAEGKYNRYNTGKNAW